MSKQAQSYNIGTSNYSKLEVQPWHLWDEVTKQIPYQTDIIKRLIRQKDGEKELDRKKIWHIIEKLDELREKREELYQRLLNSNDVNLTEEERFMLFCVFIGINYKETFQHFDLDPKSL